jgi:hypothetical protein
MRRWVVPIGALMAITSISASRWIVGGPQDGLLAFGLLMTIAVFLWGLFSDE